MCGLLLSTLHTPSGIDISNRRMLPRKWTTWPLKGLPNRQCSETERYPHGVEKMIEEKITGSRTVASGRRNHRIV